MRRNKRLWRLVPLIAILSIIAVGCGNPSMSALDPSGVVAEQQLNMILISLGVMILVFAVVIALWTYVVIKFRERPGQEKLIPKQVEGNHVLEIIWTAVPILLLIVIAIPMVMMTFSLAEEYSEEEHPTAIRVNVTGHQYWWEFEYPDLGVLTAQELYIPVGEKVFLEIDSSDVIHSFWVPALAGKMDNNPGLINTMWLEADKTGEFRGMCAELCGPAHALMYFKVVVVEQDEFDGWVDSMVNFVSEPETAVAEQGREIFAQTCIGCHAVGPEGGTSYPNLTGFADRSTIAGFLDNNEELLREWIADPQVLKPGNAMPGFDLNEEEMDALIEYLKTLTLDY